MRACCAGFSLSSALGNCAWLILGYSTPGHQPTGFATPSPTTLTPPFRLTPMHLSPVTYMKNQGILASPVLAAILEALEPPFPDKPALPLCPLRDPPLPARTALRLFILTPTCPRKERVDKEPLQRQLVRRVWHRGERSI